MGDSIFIPASGHNPTWILQREKQLLLKHYDFLEVAITDRSLKCIGRCRPSDLSVEYTYRVKFSPGALPTVHSINPCISYDANIHMYKEDNSLCLFYPADYSWTADSNLYNTIIPWTHEWFLYYELYKILGKWLHPAKEHSVINQKK